MIIYIFAYFGALVVLWKLVSALTQAASTTTEQGQPKSSSSCEQDVDSVSTKEVKESHSGTSGGLKKRIISQDLEQKNEEEEVKHPLSIEVLKETNFQNSKEDLASLEEDIPSCPNDNLDESIADGVIETVKEEDIRTVSCIPGLKNNETFPTKESSLLSERVSLKQITEFVEPDALSDDGINSPQIKESADAKLNCDEDISALLITTQNEPEAVKICDTDEQNSSCIQTLTRQIDQQEKDINTSVLESSSITSCKKQVILHSENKPETPLGWFVTEKAEQVESIDQSSKTSISKSEVKEENEEGGTIHSRTITTSTRTQIQKATRLATLQQFSFTESDQNVAKVDPDSMLDATSPISVTKTKPIGGISLFGGDLAAELKLKLQKRTEESPSSEASNEVQANFDEQEETSEYYCPSNVVPSFLMTDCTSEPSLNFEDPVTNSTLFALTKDRPKPPQRRKPQGTINAPTATPVEETC